MSGVMRSSWLTLLLTVALVAVSVVLAELIVRPAGGGQRAHLVVVLAAPALVAAALVPLLRRWVARRASVAGAALLVGLLALGVGAVTASAASNAMFLSSHDYRLFLVVLLLSSGLALLVGAQLTRPLATDIARLGEVAERVAAGDLTARTRIDRTDEVGRAAHAVDSMVDTLAETSRERERVAEARNVFLSSVGHDLRTPLAAMRAVVESLQDGVSTDRTKSYGVLAAEIGNVQALIERLTEFARVESNAAPVPTERVAVAEVVDEAVEALQPLADRRGIRLAATVGAPGWVWATWLDVARMVRNVVDNAIGHSPDRGVVDIVVTTSAEWVDVVVRDQGPGFPDWFRALAFEPFSRADPARGPAAGHAGLGLAITRTLADQHGGRVAVEPGPGGVIRITLPAARKDNEQ